MKEGDVIEHNRVKLEIEKAKKEGKILFLQTHLYDCNVTILKILKLKK